MITIAHLYYDLLNLYGESGNVKALKNALEQTGNPVTIKFLTTTDILEFDKYDFVYIGTGTEDNQLLALKHLLKYTNDIKKYIASNKFMLATGNAMELFGKYIYSNGKKIKTLNIFDYITEIENFRMVDEALCEANFLKKPVIGFQNHFGVISNIKKPLFKVIKGIGSTPTSKDEGVHSNNFFGTYLIGPLLIRNPELLKYICLNLAKQKGLNKPLINLALETKAYDTFIANYYKTYITKKKS